MTVKKIVPVDGATTVKWFWENAGVTFLNCDQHLAAKIDELIANASRRDA